MSLAPTQTKEAAYITLVRPQLEQAGPGGNGETHAH